MSPVFMDARLWFFILIAGIWIRRSSLALHALYEAPVVNPEEHYPFPDCPKVSVIIPAKNEERNIGECLDRFLEQDYPNYEVIVANDSSKDRTADILKSYGSKIQTVNVSPTPKGWTGKNFAVHSALSHATGEWYLFTDADTRHCPSSISVSLAHARTRKLSFLTLLPECLTDGAMENIFQPAMMGFIGLWFPLNKINDPASPIHFANGQYLLIESDLYHRIGGHEKVFDQYLEDFALMRESKALGERAECALGMSIYGTRMYEKFSSLWRGWRRIFLHAFRKNTRFLIVKVLDVFMTAVLPFGILCTLVQSPSLLSGGTFLLWISALLMAGLIWGVAWKTYGIVKARRRYVIFLPLAALTLCGILIHASWIAATGQKTKWR